MVASRPERGKLISQWETNNNVFKIRVSEYEEKGALLAGAYYVFESASLNSDTWQQIMTFRHDDRVGIPKDQVRFVDERIGYTFMGWMCAVTKDGGASWTVWDAKKDLPNWQCCNYGLIRELSIAEDGKGVMRLNPVVQRGGEVPELHTKDYGQHWSVTQDDV
jgi:hypothetical protein